jgi:FKBP-type peptidyl-prolyl cis-trans isomerase
MKNRNFLIVLALCFSFNSFSQKKVKLETRIDSVSYAIGVSMFQSASQFNHEIDYNMVVAGILAASKQEAMMTPEAAMECITMVANTENEARNMQNLEEGKRFLEKNKMEEGIVETASGLQYRIIEPGDGPKPTNSDKVKVHYTGYLLDGTVFDSSVERGEPVVFGVTQVIQGWTEALQLMPIGSKFKVFIPSNLAYGDRQMGNDIMPGSTLVFDIELLEIVID